jgi:hypothetical protein
MKRHEKPYACTYPDCTKCFGSKNDWKRHENSQHFQIEYWRCAEKIKAGSTTKTCGKVYHRKETFRIHLEKEHGIPEANEIRERESRYRIGRNYDNRFWCGFCRQTIEFTSNGGVAWAERFDHIDGHYNGKTLPKMDFTQWIHPSEPIEELDARPLPKIKGDLEESESSTAVRSVTKSLKRQSAESGLERRVKRTRIKADSGAQQILYWTCVCSIVLSFYIFHNFFQVSD